MSDSRLYSRLLLPKGHGYPLFRPEPFDDLPVDARRRGTEIGDVGVLTSDGSFDVIFNICRPAEDPLNRFRVPEGFEQIRLGAGDVAPREQYYRPGSDVSSTNVAKRRLDIAAGVDGNVQVSSLFAEVSDNHHLLVSLHLAWALSWKYPQPQVRRRRAYSYSRMAGLARTFVVCKGFAATRSSMRAIGTRS